MRPTAKAKAGYYPAPPSIVTALGRYITNPHLQPGRLLDPCAGEGLAAALLLKQFPALDGYAIELDKCRAEQCRARLTHVLRSDAHVVKMQRDSINLLFLNSPYDTERGGLRTEFTWLKRWTPMLQPKGVLVYVIPDAQYSEQVLEYLSTYYREPSLFRFPDPEYHRFRQTVFIGTKVTSPNPSQLVRTALWNLLRKQALPVCGINKANYVYTLPPLALKHPIEFSSQWMDPLDLYALAHEQGLWQDRSTLDLLNFSQTQLANPLLPLRIGHLTRMIIAGMFNNQTIHQNGARWIIKGRGRKHTQELPPLVESVPTKEGLEDRTHYRTIERYVPEIRAWNLTEGPAFGTYITIDP